jgi:hypothetical protein
MAEQYDAFISHASEDKPTIANLLARYLVSYRLSIWYDEFTLEVGDSLNEKINYGWGLISPSITLYYQIFKR